MKTNGFKFAQTLGVAVKLGTPSLPTTKICWTCTDDRARLEQWHRTYRTRSKIFLVRIYSHFISTSDMCFHSHHVRTALYNTRKIRISKASNQYHFQILIKTKQRTNEKNEVC